MKYLVYGFLWVCLVLASVACGETASPPQTEARESPIVFDDLNVEQIQGMAAVSDQPT